MRGSPPYLGYVVVSAVFAVVSAAGLGVAEAHPGHVADAGQGHSHWLALVVLGGLGGLAAGGLIFRAIAGRLPFVDAKARGR